MSDTPKRAAARDAVVSAAMTWWASGAPTPAQTAALAVACESLYDAHRPPGLMCIPCDGASSNARASASASIHSSDCPIATLTGGAA